jgi:hypothetical protein
MITFVVQLNVRDVENWVRALDRVLGRSHFWADRDGGELNRKCAQSYSNRVLLAILNQRFTYRGYTDRYATWKTKVGGIQSFWQLEGDLAEALTHFKEGVGWKGGIPAHVMDSGGKSWNYPTMGSGNKGKRKSIAMYGIVMEFGLADHPKREVFWPVYKEFADFEWQRNQWVALQDIGNYWR